MREPSYMALVLVKYIIPTMVVMRCKRMRSLRFKCNDFLACHPRYSDPTTLPQ